ncbi:MAG: hypothetical protein AAGE84_13575 [Cyanobacteria bacterium P01_G01_bin.39]
MSALRQPDFYTEYYSPQANPKKTNNQHQTPQQTISSSPKVIKSKAFSTPANLPKNLKNLSLIQKSSFGLAIASMTASIGLYISTVQIPKLWSQEYQHLENLQRQERQLIAINETIKYQIAQEASQNNQLAISNPESAVFINPAKVELKDQSELLDHQSKLAELKLNSLGY